MDNSTANALAITSIRYLVGVLANLGCAGVAARINVDHSSHDLDMGWSFLALVVFAIGLVVGWFVIVYPQRHQARVAR